MEDNNLRGPEDARLAFFTFGMLIIDEIDFGDGIPKEENVLGGAGTYSALGARLAAGGPSSQKIGWIVDQGFDFPSEMTRLIQSWQTNCDFRHDQSRTTTRAWNGYTNDHRAFRYTTPKKRIEVHRLTDHQVMAKSFHLVCDASRFQEVRHHLYDRRQGIEDGCPPPIVVWEPIPDRCTPEELGNFRDAARRATVVSPNAEELAAFFGPDSKRQEVDMVNQVLGRKPGSGDDSSPFIVRHGAEGCILYKDDTQVRFHAFHQDHEKVRDPTGGGNAFLGALAIGLTNDVTPNAGIFEKLAWNSAVASYLLDETRNKLVSAVIHATVAASFVIEQVGMPMVDPANPDIWNDQSYTERFNQYLTREERHLIGEMSQGQ